MKIYFISNGKGYEPTLLVHEEDFGEEEFREICDEAMNKAAEHLLEQAKGRTIEILNLIRQANKFLVQDHGFKPPERISRNYGFGWLSDSKAAEEILPTLPEGLRQKIVEHNKSARNENERDSRD